MFVHLLRPDLVGTRGMGASAADRPGRLRADHRAADARHPRHAVPLPRPSDRVSHSRLRSGTVGLSSVRLKRGNRASNEVDSNVRPKHARKLDGLHDVAVKRVDMDVTRCKAGRFLALLLRLRRLCRCWRLRGLLGASSAFRRPLGLRGSGRRRVVLLGIRRRHHTPCFDWRETYVRSGDFSSLTYPPRAASRNRIRRFVGPGIEPWRSTYGFRMFP